MYKRQKGKEDLNRFPEKLGFFSKKKVGKKLIWFHAASIGEIKSVHDLIEEYKKNLNLKKQPFKHLVLKDLKRQKDRKVWCFQSVVL